MVRLHSIVQHVTHTHHSSISLSLIIILLVSLIAGASFAPVAYANASYTVNSLDDNTFDDNDCTLREAILVANNAAANDDCGAASAADDTIDFSVSGTITLTATLPEIAASQGSLTINGGGDITISGNNARHILQIAANSAVTLNNLTIANGRTDYGGGGILSIGILSISNCTFINNQAMVYGGGGAIYNGGTLTVTQSTFTANKSSIGSSIFNAPDAKTLTVSDSTFADGDGGAIHNSSGVTTTITNSTFSNNTDDFAGGGINNDGILNVIGSTFSGNSASYLGGGGINNSSTLTVTRSTFTNNQATSGASGGGIANYGTATIIQSAFINNTVGDSGGGIDNSGTLTIVNSTFSGNTAGESGGGIENFGSLTVANTTFSGNTAGFSGGSINLANGTATIKNTIITNSTPTNCSGMAFAASSANNLATDASCGASFSQVTGAQLGLGALTGTPAYFPLTAGSVAIDAGDNAICAAAPVNNQSQNGLTRPLDGDANGTATCDIGAYEYEAIPAPNLQAHKTNNVAGFIKPGNVFTWTINLVNTGSVDATFSNGQVLLRDELPPGATYGAPTIQNLVNVTNSGNLACTITSNVLTCSASGGPVTVGSTSGAFTVQFSVAPAGFGTLHNPVTGGVCRADPDGLIAEGNDANNDCTDSVIVADTVIYLPLIQR